MALSTFLDLIACCATKSTLAEFVAGSGDRAAVKTELYNNLHGKLLVRAVVVDDESAIACPGSSFYTYLRNTQEYMEFTSKKLPVLLSASGSKFNFTAAMTHYVEGNGGRGAVMGDGAVATNSVFNGAGGGIGAGAVVEHSKLSGDWSVGSTAMCSGVRSPSVAHDLQVFT
jgi:hypothetical protein